MSNQNSTVTKSSTDLYLIRAGIDGGSVALRFGKECVTVMAHTSYGTYGYFWSHTGPNPKQFLCDVGMNYAMEKLSGYNLYEPDQDKYETEIKQLIIEARLDGRLEKHEAREVWDELLNALITMGANDVFAWSIFDRKHCGKLFSDYESLPSGKRVRPQCQGFWDHIWKPLVAQLIADIAKSRCGKCDWCKEEATDLRPRRDYDEGLYGPVYEVCGECVRKDNEEIGENE